MKVGVSSEKSNSISEHSHFIPVICVRHFRLHTNYKCIVMETAVNDVLLPHKTESFRETPASRLTRYTRKSEKLPRWYGEQNATIAMMKFFSCRNFTCMDIRIRGSTSTWSSVLFLPILSSFYIILFLPFTCFICLSFFLHFLLTDKIVNFFRYYFLYYI